MKSMEHPGQEELKKLQPTVKEKALTYNNVGLRVAPCYVDWNENKIKPATKWTELKGQNNALTQEEILEHFSQDHPNNVVISLICGEDSNGLEVIDIENKNGAPENLAKQYTDRVREASPGLIEKLVIEKTKSNGTHLLYRTSEPLPKVEVLAKSPDAGTWIEVLAGARLVTVSPSLGYSLQQGEIDNLPEITPEERDLLLSIAREFNEHKPKPKRTTPSKFTYMRTTSGGRKPGEHYDEEGDHNALLTRNGWIYFKSYGNEEQYTRPGKEKPEKSGAFYRDTRKFVAYSTSANLEPNKAYSLFGLKAELEHGGDYSATARALREEGYGDQAWEDIPSYPIQHTRVTTEVTYKPEKAGETEETRDIELAVPGNSVDFYKAESSAIIETHREASPEERKEVRELIERFIKAGITPFVVPDSDGQSQYFYEYLLDVEILKAHREKAKDPDNLSALEIENLTRDIIDLASNLKGLDRDRFKKTLTRIPFFEEQGYTVESIEEEIAKLANVREQEENEQNLQGAILQAQKLLEEGKSEEATKHLEKTLKSTKTTTHNLESLLNPPSFAECEEQLRQAGEAVPTGYKIGDTAFDLPKGAISLIAGATGHGKTTFLLNCAVNMVRGYNQKGEVHFFTMEEATPALFTKALTAYQAENSEQNVLTTWKVKEDLRGTLPKNELDKAPGYKSMKEKFQREIWNKKLFIHSIGSEIDLLESAVRHLRKTRNVKAIVVDYIQLISPSSTGKKTYSRQEEVKEICMTLKDLAVDTDLPILLGAQYNRQATNPTQIQLQNIGEAGDIERVISLGVGIWNLEKSHTLSDKDWDDFKGRRASNKNQGLYIEVLKNREGESGQYGALDFKGDKLYIKPNNIDQEDQLTTNSPY